MLIFLPATICHPKTICHLEEKTRSERFARYTICYSFAKTTIFFILSPILVVVVVVVVVVIRSELHTNISDKHSMTFSDSL